MSVISSVEILTKCQAASAHIHTHQKKIGSNERTQDGAFSPRDRDHYTDDDNNNINNHHQEFDHEAIIGSVKEAEEFDHLPIDESKKRLKILLEKMDLDGDNYIERNELKAWILRSFSMLSAEESLDRLQDADTNDDGKISWEEILHDTYGTDPEDLQIDEKLVNDDKDTFKLADLNNDGYLDTEEFKSYSHPEESPRMYPLLLEQSLQDKDIDNDKFISFQEYLGDRAKDQDKEWLLAEKDKFDNDLDKNNDGKLESSEILSWLVPSNDDLATDEVDHLFAASDDDHDNRLSFDEVLDHHDVFVGSEATDYGDYLHDIERFTDEL